MTKIRREKAYQNVYRIFAGILAVSAVLMFFMGIAPLGIGVSWSGSDLVLTRAHALSEAGATIARGGVLTNEVQVLMVAEVFRMDGELSYRALNDSSEEFVLVAREAQQTVLASVPILGYWVKALSHPIGVLALVGIPLFTFALDAMVVAWVGGIGSRMSTLLASLPTRRSTRAKREQNTADGAHVYEEDVYEPHHEQTVTREDEPKTPARHIPETYGMTIRLSRPQRYGMHAQ